MKISLSEWWRKICNCYFSNPNYVPENDPNITYDEFLLIQNVHFMLKFNVRENDYAYPHNDIVDTKDFDYYDELWENTFIAQFNQTKECRKDLSLDNILVKRCDKDNFIPYFKELSAKPLWYHIEENRIMLKQRETEMYKKIDKYRLKHFREDSKKPYEDGIKWIIS